MAIQLSDLGQVYLVCGKTDMRQGIGSLAYLVKRQFELDPFSGQVFLFCGGRKDRFKAHYWGVYESHSIFKERLNYHRKQHYIFIHLAEYLHSYLGTRK
ncbi:IS66 family insertion sequence element accessory protein TnpB [Streptococcus thoraltensis]|uniref:IS66 family insertion sequence element accessory protein TnpB n=1 Tax=Streptococcus thoraltensis TaxID=55085 RepID=UPI001F58C43D|nr:IS66 family insertion sequence element accessory protein TnpB [Streptococcus thoraltensis]